MFRAKTHSVAPFCIYKNIWRGAHIQWRKIVYGAYAHTHTVHTHIIIYYTSIYKYIHYTNAHFTWHMHTFRLRVVHNVNVMPSGSAESYIVTLLFLNANHIICTGAIFFEIDFFQNFFVFMLFKDELSLDWKRDPSADGQLYIRYISRIDYGCILYRYLLARLLQDWPNPIPTQDCFSVMS